VITYKINGNIIIYLYANYYENEFNKEKKEMNKKLKDEIKKSIFIIINKYASVDLKKIKVYNKLKYDKIDNIDNDIFYDIEGDIIITFSGITNSKLKKMFQNKLNDKITNIYKNVEKTYPHFLPIEKEINLDNIKYIKIEE